MAEVKWIKIVTDIFDDEKILLIESLPEAESIFSMKIPYPSVGSATRT